MLVALCGTLAFAVEVNEPKEEIEKTSEKIKGRWVFFLGRAEPCGAEPTTEAVECLPKVKVRAFVAAGRAKGKLSFDGDTHDLVARRDKNGVWHGVLYKDGERTGALRGRYLHKRKAFVGGMKLGEDKYRIGLRRVYPSSEEALPVENE